MFSKAVHSSKELPYTLVRVHLSDFTEIQAASVMTVLTPIGTFSKMYFLTCEAEAIPPFTNSNQIVFLTRESKIVS
jgi:hypothetical protein